MRQMLCIWITLAGCHMGNEPIYDEPVSTPSALTARQAIEIVPARGISEVNWPQALEAKQLPRDVAVPEELDLPVLLLDEPVATFVSGELWYTATYRFSDHNVVVEGTRIIFDDSIPEGVTIPVRAAPRVAITHHIVDATFVAWGASYTVSMECENAATNPKCANGKAVTAVIDELLVADSPAALREAR